jgi:hypothetical protein
MVKEVEKYKDEDNKQKERIESKNHSYYRVVKDHHPQLGWTDKVRETDDNELDSAVELRTVLCNPLVLYLLSQNL